jgi:hypothetical protein
MSKPVCIFQAPLFTRSGYGDWGVAIGKSLLRYNKFELITAPTIWGACSKKNLDSEINDPEGKELFNRVIKSPLTRQPELFIQMTIPNEFATPAKYNIGMTAGIETTVPKPEWLEGLNRMNLNIVTSVHARDVFVCANYNKKLPNGTSEELKVKTPMEILFWGADTKVYHKTDEKIASLEESLKELPESFCFLFVGQWTAGNMRADRKAIGFLIKTFLETFAGVENPPALILKTSGAQICIMDKYECINKIREVTNMVKQGLPPNIKLPNIYLLHGELEDKEMNALYNHEKVKVHVSFTHGEGFGHPLLIATLSGKPLLTPHWSGHLDFLNPKLCKFFEGNLVPIPDEALNEWFIKDARWFEVDYVAAGQKMRQYFRNYSDDILKNAEALRVENAEKFSIETMDKVFHAILDKYVPKFAIEEPIILPKLKKLSFSNKGLPPITAITASVTMPAGGCSPSIPGEGKTTSSTTLIPVK